MQAKNPVKALILLLLLSPWAFSACDHSKHEVRLRGYWEGSLPLPSTGETIPVAYSFQEDALVVWVGIGTEQVTSHWPAWKVEALHDGDLVVLVIREDQRSYSMLVRELASDEIMLWDPGTDEMTAARVRRATPPPERDPTNQSENQPNL